MLIQLLDGRALTATELAHVADITPQTASSHLALLTKGELLRAEQQGRYRYYRLSSQEVAQTIESLMALAAPRKSPHSSQDLPAISAARTCYDHIAGRLGVELADALSAIGWLVPASGAYEVTVAGEAGLSNFGLELDRLRKQRRQFSRQCLDWTERRHHIAGALGAALAEKLFERNWLIRNKAERVVHVTNAGVLGMREVFGLRL